MIVREGVAPVLGATLAALLIQSQVSALWAVVPWLAVAFLCWIYRFPRIRLIVDPRGILSPVSGRLERLETAIDPYRQCPVLRLQIRVTPPGITLLRNPVEGQVKEIYLRQGVYGGEQRLTRESESPDCYAANLKTDEGQQMVYAISSNWPISRCSLDRGPGERVGQGQRSGFFYFASYVDVLIPVDSDVEVEVNQRLIAGKTQLARLPR